MTPESALCRIIYATNGEIPEGSPLLWKLRDMLLAEVRVAEMKATSCDANPVPLVEDQSFNLAAFQFEVAEWVERNFGKPWTWEEDQAGVFDEFRFLSAEHPLVQRLEKLERERLIHHQFMGLAEEVGELAHSMLKEEQGIRGTAEEHQFNAKDAVGDLLVFLAAYCFRRGWNLPQIVEAVWSEVSKRDWRKNPQTGGTK